MKLLNHQEQAWENACSTLVRELGYHHTPNQMAQALFLGQTLARSGLSVQLHSQKIQHQFGNWSTKTGGTTWQVVRREEETVAALKVEGLLLFPSGSGSSDEVLRQAHDRQASRTQTDFPWLELNSRYISAPAITPVTKTEDPDRPSGLSRSLSRWLNNPFRPTYQEFERKCQEVFNQCLSENHAQQVVHYACHLLTEAGLPCDGRRSFSGYPRSDIPNRFRCPNRFDVCFHSEHGQGFSRELKLSGVGMLFGWSYQTGDRRDGKFQEWHSSNWFPLSPPRPDNVLKLSQALAAAIREHRLEQALPPALSANKRRF